jgi:eukaryotic-like serine/threonine-protein kinase
MADAADCDQLFGLIALQVGLIDQAQLVSALEAWAPEKDGPLADLLLDRGDLDADQRSAVDAILRVQLKAHGGDTERCLASLPVGRSIRDRFGVLKDPDLTVTVVRSGLGSESTDAHAADALAVGAATADGQRFRILRPHARGGLGAVFVALDGELNREVALKEILESHVADPTNRQRFLREAEITGGLEHPGIVPVYGLGAHKDGRPFYAMRLIHGASFKEAIERFHEDAASKKNAGRRSLALRKLVLRFLDVCNAIDYAHSRGILHRDIKPANIIVGRHGETLVVDWGLARLMSRPVVDTAPEERALIPSSAGGSGETLPGSVLGTPAYMSPEQAMGRLEALGTASDVYSLGATLYFLLTGRAPFEGAQVGEVLRAVQRGAFPKPRAIEPKADRALEAVCLKSMATDPSRRYPTVRVLADDVERWIADEPVSVVRELFWHRISRRLRRRPIEGLLVLLLGLGGFGVVSVFEMYRVERFMNEMNYDWWTGALKSRDMRSRVRMTDLSIWLDEAGRQYAEQGKYDQAGQAFERALVIREELIRGGPKDSYLRLLDHYSAFLRSTGQRARAESLERRAALLLRGLEIETNTARE